MAFDKDAFLAALDTMTVLELNDLVKAVETKFGVSAAAVAVAGGGANTRRSGSKDANAGFSTGTSTCTTCVAGARAEIAAGAAWTGGSSTENSPASALISLTTARSCSTMRRWCIH